jgi:hypothetical protein
MDIDSFLHVFSYKFQEAISLKLKYNNIFMHASLKVLIGFLIEYQIFNALRSRCFNICVPDTLV